MKRTIGILAALALTLVPLAAQAASFAGGNEYTLTQGQNISGNLYVGANVANVGGRIGGDLIAGAGTLTVTGPVGKDVLAAAGTLQLLSSVGDDVRVAGGTVTVGGRIGGDLLVTGGTVHILPDSVIAGSVYVSGGQTVVDGTIGGDVHASGGTLTINGTISGDVNARLGDRLIINDSAVVGDVAYKAAHQAQIASGARTGTVTRDTTGAGKPAKAIFWLFLSILTAMKTLALLGLAALVMWRWRRQFTELAQEVTEKFWPSVGRGVGYGVLVPIGTVLLLMSFVGTLAGALAGLAYVASLILARLLAGVVLGAWLAKLTRKGRALQLTWLNVLGGTLVFEFIGFIPVVGPLARLLLGLAAFGVLARRVQRMMF